MTLGLATLLAVGMTVARATAAEPRASAEQPYPSGAFAWRSTHASEAIRGVTVGPIENQLHPGRGYGSPACARTMGEIRRLGGNWVSLTPFGRVWDLKPTGISLSFEAPFVENRQALLHAIAQAHAEGLRVLLVPHLWVETGEWRALIDPGTDEGWKRWVEAYQRFVLTWAKVAAEGEADMLAFGVEMRRALTTERGADFAPLLEQVRKVYRGPLTYAANWDDVNDTVLLGQFDVIGLNAFYPLAQHENASFEELQSGALRVRDELALFARRWQKPILFTEFGYSSRRDPALRPWEWPEHLAKVVVDEQAQAQAYRALLAGVKDEPWFAGVFLWRFYADPDDVSQEAEWGFSPRGKLAELELRDAFASHWGGDGPRPYASFLTRPRADRVGLY